ncbi:hypothetical protein [Bifidobacterium cuniculi]|uniref:Uncharacterized protein n=1 Tax=Bifidobacterium cuniculi TaxID=1688 RepID=A0A087B3X0_9BIFI|nr:hypothetical protein [Bifidobacterium cuniculi]KFI65720.1 hypothetical protein BCUN_0215 [Bifidobacterium cuniculi]
MGGVEHAPQGQGNDTNAACNILEAGLQHLVGLDEAERETRILDTMNTLREHGAILPTRKPQH